MGFNALRACKQLERIGDGNAGRGGAGYDLFVRGVPGHELAECFLPEMVFCSFSRLAWMLRPKGAEPAHRSRPTPAISGLPINTVLTTCLERRFGLPD